MDNQENTSIKNIGKVNDKPLILVNDNQEEQHLEQDPETNEILDTFKAKHVGRGIWHVEHTLSACFVNQNGDISNLHNKIMTVYMCFIVYCKFIYCGICRHHAAGQIHETSITSIIESPDSNTPNILFDWFYDFHRAANIHAGKSSPSREDVREFFIEGKENSIKRSNYSYDKIHTGIWHLFFLLSTKCHSHEQIACVYYLMLEYMPHLPQPQKTYFAQFCEKHRFTEALNDLTLPNEVLCICFFDWIHAMYEDMNKRSNVKVYPLEKLKNIYFYLDVCNKDCDK